MAWSLVGKGKCRDGHYLGTRRRRSTSSVSVTSTSGGTFTPTEAISLTGDYWVVCPQPTSRARLSSCVPERPWWYRNAVVVLYFVYKVYVQYIQSLDGVLVRRYMGTSCMSLPHKPISQPDSGSSAGHKHQPESDCQVSRKRGSIRRAAGLALDRRSVCGRALLFAFS